MICHTHVFCSPKWIKCVYPAGCLESECQNGANKAVLEYQYLMNFLEIEYLSFQIENLNSV